MHIGEFGEIAREFGGIIGLFGEIVRVFGEKMQWVLEYVVEKGERKVVACASGIWEVSLSGAVKRGELEMKGKEESLEGKVVKVGRVETGGGRKGGRDGRRFE